MTTRVVRSVVGPVEDFPGHGQAHLLVSVDEYPVNHLEHYNGQFGSAEEARAAADHLDGMHFVGIGGGYEAMDDDQLNHYRGEAEHRAAVADRIAACTVCGITGPAVQ